MWRNTLPLIAATVLLTAAVAGHTQQPKPDESTVKTLEAFDKRVAAVVDLRKKLETKLPRLPEEATPQEIDANQRALETEMRRARAGAKAGDLLTPDVQALIRRVVQDLLSRPEGRQLKASILDENPVGLVVGVNDRYPDEVPLATMPPQLLKALPPIPEELEYRFVGNSLVILDPLAHLIMDVLPGVFLE